VVDEEEGLWVEVLAADDLFLRGGSLPDGGSGFRIFLENIIASKPSNREKCHIRVELGFGIVYTLSHSLFASVCPLFRNRTRGISRWGSGTQELALSG
jgi:hypothetical protein